MNGLHRKISSDVATVREESEKSVLCGGKATEWTTQEKSLGSYTHGSEERYARIHTIKSWLKVSSKGQQKV